MLTFNRQSAEEELALAEIALQDALESSPIEASSRLIELEGRQETELAQLVVRQQAVLQATYEKHRQAVQSLKEQHALVINEMFQANREAKVNLSSVHAEQKSELQAVIGAIRAEHRGKVLEAKQRVKNATAVLRQLDKQGK